MVAMAPRGCNSTHFGTTGPLGAVQLSIGLLIHAIGSLGGCFPCLQQCVTPFQSCTDATILQHHFQTFGDDVIKSSPNIHIPKLHNV